MTYDEKYETMIWALDHAGRCATCQPGAKRVLVELDNEYRMAWLARVHRCPRAVVGDDPTP